MGKMGSAQEMNYGDAAAAFLVSDQDVIAEYKGSYTLTSDFGDRVRGRFSKFDRQWEDRWIRDMGFENLIPKVVDGLLKKYQLELNEFSRVIYCCHYGAARKKLDKRMGLNPEKVQDIMTKKVVSVDEDASLDIISKIFTDKPYRRIPVTCKGKLIGIINRADIMDNLLCEYR